MAIKKNTNDLLSQAATTLADNSTQDISPQDVREMAENNAFSNYNKITDNALVGLKNYSTAATYEAAQGIVYNGSIYISNTIPTPGAFNASQWDILSGGEINTSSNSGAGQGLALAKSGSNLPFKSLTAGTGITLTSAANELQISSAGGTDTNLSTTDLTQLNEDRNYTIPSTKKLIFGGLGGEVRLQDAVNFNMFNGDSATASNVRYSAFVGANTCYLFFNNGRTSIKTVSDDLTLTGQATSAALQSKIVLGAEIDLQVKPNRAVQLKTDKVFFMTPAGAVKGKILLDTFIWGASAVVGSEKFSIQVDTLIKGSDNSAATSGFKVTDINNNTLLDIKNNGQTSYGGALIAGVAHSFQNPASQGIIGLFRNAGGASTSVAISANGLLETYSNTNQLEFQFKRGFLQMYDGGVQKMRLTSQGDSYMDFANAIILKGNAIIGTEDISLQGDTLLTANVKMSNIPSLPAGTVAGELWSQNGTLRIGNPTANIQTVGSAATITPNIDTTKLVVTSALATALTIAAPTGTAQEGQELTFRFKDNGTARALTWNSVFEDYTGSLPTTTTAGKTVYIGCKYNLINTKWDVLAVQTQP